MHDYGLAHLSDTVLLRDLAALVVRDRVTTATLLAHIAEVDARRLYVPAGYASMHAYCVEELRLSEDAAYKRIQAARAARQFPALFTAVAEGQLHLAAVCLIAPHLTPENAKGLIAAATHKRKSEIEQWLARSFPIPGVRASVRAVPALEPAHDPQLAPGQVDDTELVGSHPADVDPNQDQLAPGQVDDTRTEDGGGERFLVRVTIAKSTRQKLAYAQALLSHAVPSGDVAQVLDRALDALIAQVEKRKLGAAARRAQRSAKRSRTVGDRYVPAPVRRAVWERDQGQCTFVSPTGHRCTSRRLLEFDHIDPVARGGKATIDGMRLRCRAHNQYEAERVFGVGFMSAKRHKARADEVQAQAGAAADRDVVAALRSLGCRVDVARRAAEFSQTLRGAPLEERTRAALRFLGRRSIRTQRGVGHAAGFPQRESGE